MKSETARDLALRTLNGLSHKHGVIGRVLDETFRSHPHMEDRDRALTYHLVQGVLRWQLRLDWIIGRASRFPLRKIAPEVMNILRLALYQIYFLDRVPESAAVNEAVKQAKRAAAPHVVSFVNGILRNLCRQKDGMPFPERQQDTIPYLSVFYSYPEWLVRRWYGEWGMEFTEGLLAAGNQNPLITIRANLLRTDRGTLLRHLEEEGVSCHPAPYAPQGIILDGLKGRVDQLNSFKQGLFQVQDQAAQLTSLILGPRPGDRVLDVCSGYGGKTTHLAELQGEGGNVLALDINHKRLISLTGSARRLGITHIRPVMADATRDLSSLLPTPFDRIMVDAPCSGMGVLSRHPDGKWNRGEEDIKRLARVQKAILHQAAALLKIGGRMLYVTCTLSREENDEVAEDLLAKRKGFRKENIKGYLPSQCADLVDEDGFFRTFPHKHGMDGFFAALFVKE